MHCAQLPKKKGRPAGRRPSTGRQDSDNDEDEDDEAKTNKHKTTLRHTQQDERTNQH